MPHDARASDGIIEDTFIMHLSTGSFWPLAINLGGALGSCNLIRPLLVARVPRVSVWGKGMGRGEEKAERSREGERERETDSKAEAL